MKKRNYPVFIFGALLLACLCNMVYWHISRGYRVSFDPKGPQLVQPLETRIERLEELGFTFSQEELDLLNEYRDDLESSPYGEDDAFSPGGSADSDYLPMLFLLGMGDWDTETWAWYPISHNVYALDTEVFNIEDMYLEFMAGLLAISGDTLPISHIRADNSGVDWENDRGSMALEFTLDGTPHRLEMDYMGDWLDLSVLKQINGVLAEHDVPQRFYGCTDGGQGIILVYGTPDWAKAFQRGTGLNLVTKF